MDYKPLKFIRSEWARTPLENRYLFAQVWVANIGYAIAAMPGIDLDASVMRNAELFFEPNAWKTGMQLGLPLLCTQTATTVAGRTVETVAYLAHDAAEKTAPARAYLRKSAVAVGKACSAAAAEMLRKYVMHS